MALQPAGPIRRAVDLDPAVGQQVFEPGIGVLGPGRDRSHHRRAEERESREAGEGPPGHESRAVSNVVPPSSFETLAPLALRMRVVLECAAPSS